MIVHTASELAELCGAALEGDGSKPIVGPASLSDATEDEVSFLGSPRFLPLLAETRAGCVLVEPGLEVGRDDLTLLRTEDPSRAFSRVVAAFRPTEELVGPGIHATAVVEEDVELGADVRLGAGAFVGRGSRLGDGVVLHPNATVGRSCRVGAGTRIHSAAVLCQGTVVGERCTIHAGAVLGSDGFGFEPNLDGGGGWDKIPQCGHVLVEDDVEIGANVAVDRARFGATRILRGTKIDNLVHVAHNVTVGPGALLVAQVGVAGSSTVGRGAILAGQVGVAGHITIGDHARVGGASKVFQDLEGGKEYWGYPPLEKGRQIRAVREFARLPELVKRLKSLEKRLEALEGGD
ncbi:MAG TPA: UDP-3-O-(3-hydroxymyristoyl)glucosamine N-acyltransferase [Planctomycetes bacterium]|nr:UDP-3-O-(3-hydroxymyristoyl)glucosamine N-acyltransferase [Planctomycetota bacterium]